MGQQHMSEYTTNMHEGMTMIENSFDIEVTRIEQFENGLGFGEGTISHAERLKIVGAELVAKVESVIVTGPILQPLSVDKYGNPVEDDGCGDGRGVRRIFRGFVQKAKSLVRAKVFGGGATMVTAMSIGDGSATGQTLNQAFESSIQTMKEGGIDFGAHTDEHAIGENCGCGAIDKAPDVIQNVTKYQDEITEAITGLGVDTTGLDVVMDNFREYAETVRGQPYSGKKIISDITNEGKIVKELEDHHYEMFIVLNTVEGHTVNQELIRSVSEGKIQVFVVDVWRLQELAMKRFPNDEEARNTAFLSELVYTMGVAATLTTGDLPVRILSQKSAVLTA